MLDFWIVLHIISHWIIVLEKLIGYVSVMNTLNIRYYLIFPTFNNFHSTNIWVTKILIVGDLAIHCGVNWLIRGSYQKETNPCRYFTSNQQGSFLILSSSFKNIFRDFSRNTVFSTSILSICWGWIFGWRCAFPRGKTTLSISPPINWEIPRNRHFPSLNWHDQITWIFSMFFPLMRRIITSISIF